MSSLSIVQLDPRSESITFVEKGTSFRPSVTFSDLVTSDTSSRELTFPGVGVGRGLHSWGDPARVRRRDSRVVPGPGHPSAYNRGLRPLLPAGGTRTDSARGQDRVVTTDPPGSVYWESRTGCFTLNLGDGVLVARPFTPSLDRTRNSCYEPKGTRVGRASGRGTRYGDDGSTRSLEGPRTSSPLLRH